MQREFALSNAGRSAALDFIAETVARAGRDAAVGHRLSVIVDEVCANMIHHDASLTEAHRFSLELTGEGTGMVLVICDPGHPFNPLEHRQGTLPEIGGRGLDLIRDLSSGASYERAGACNRLTVAIAPET